MASVNKVIVLGNVGSDPEVRYMPNGNAVTTVSVATTKKFKDKEGNKQERTEWHRVVFFNKLAEIVGEYVKKSSSIYLEGELRTRPWKDNDGKDRYTTEIVANEMQILSKKEQQDSKTPEKPRSEAKNQAPDADYSDFDDDIPF